jgi:hypothetical protein
MRLGLTLAAMAMAAMLATGPLPVLAQTAEALPSPELACLTPALEQREAAVYPPERLERKEGAFFHLDLTFTHPERAPSMKVVEDTKRTSDVRTAGDFVEVAERYARQLRVPCLQPGARFVLRQTFHFVPNDGRRVTVSQPSEDFSPAFTRLLDCLQPQRGTNRWPRYPARALQDGLQGNVVVQVRFEGPDAPPQVEVLNAPPRGSLLANTVRDAFANLRATCAGPEPVSGRMLFTFKIEDDRRVVLRDLNLRQLAGGMRNYPAPAYFDTRAMGCPFDLRVQYMAPHMSNVVAEVGDAVPERRPLLQWLAKVELNLPEPQHNLVLGDRFTLHVPCLTLDVPPRSRP